ncbi:MAG: VWA domain-containing protein [Hungatella sp.]|jgi:Ca-activated chloride channel family protein|nr:VWA domain-containing protein [Hungatella sp.]MCI9637990.1 VWA domain-containing protein [Hungatella sp.]
MKNSKNQGLVIAGIGVAVFVLAFAGIMLTRNAGKSAKTVSTESAAATIEKYVKKIGPAQAPVVKSPVELADTSVDELPDIDTNEITVSPVTSLYAEIFSTSEKCGAGKDGWINEVAERFNREGFEVDGKPVSVMIRNVASGLGMDYIKSGKYLPDGYTPSNDFWGKMLIADGVLVEVVSERLVGNTAGILLTRDTQKQLLEKYGAINLKTIVDATENGEFAMGYTNPYASATGLNFLISTLQTYNARDPLSNESVDGFQTFQANVPFVAYTTLQMREAAETGTLDGFVMEYQTYINDPELTRKYEFTPFGFIHTNPLYTPQGTSAQKKQILQMFAEFSQSEENQELAGEYGFNVDLNYTVEQNEVDGTTLLNAQELWKKEKDSGRPILAVFVADVSGSMGGQPLNALKTSLINGMRYINTTNYIGLVSYSDDVVINVPVGKFDLNQQSAFKGAVESLSASGGTATFDGIIVAADMLIKAREQYPDAKMMMFVLSDGETNRGHLLKDIQSPIDALNIPIYTIGYNADIPALESISAINEAASINADSDDVVYQLRNLFNSSL